MPRGVKGTWVAAGLAVAAVVAGVAACSSSSNALTRAELAQGCVLDSDCTSPDVCAFQTCHVACETSADCQPVPGTRCVESDKPANVCLNPAESSCVRNSGCPGTEICGVDLQCRDVCVNDRDCLDDETCVGGVCALPAELTDGTLPDKVDSGAMATCVHASDCPASLVCVGGACAPECVTTKDCPTSWSCYQTRCAPPGYDAGADAGSMTHDAATDSAAADAGGADDADADAD